MVTKAPTKTLERPAPPARIRVDVAIDLIDDNPYNVRSYFNPLKVGELADSIKQIGLRQVPEARKVGARYQLAYGHMRKRAFIRLNKEAPKAWPTMPLDVAPMTDEQMMLFSVEENLKRSDVKPLEVARCLGNYFTVFPDTKETEIAKKLNIEQGTVSNMRRVLTLPKDILDKIDEGRINFTMARELLVFAGLSSCHDSQRTEKLDAEGLMKAACHGLGGSGYDAAPATVDGLKKQIYRTATSHFKALENTGGGYGYGSGEVALFSYKAAGCLKCEHLFEAYETKAQKRHFCTDAKCFTKLQEEHKTKAAAEARAKMAADIAKRVKAGPKADKTASKTIPQEIPRAAELEAEARAASPHGALAPTGEPCDDCLNRFKCDGRRREPQNGKMVCASVVTEKTFAKVAEKAKVEVPESLKALMTEAGSRGEILDLNNIRFGSYSLKEGYTELTRQVAEDMDDPKECTERCTHGFHFAFDSKPGYEGKVDTATHYICTDRKCMGQKKATLTRKKNEKGTHLKNAERQAIKQAVDETTGMDSGRLKLVLLSQIDGSHVSGGGGYGSQPGMKQWLLERVGVIHPANGYGFDPVKALLPALNKLNPVELARLLVEFSLKSLTYTGEIHNYQIETTAALNLLGIGINLEDPRKAEASAPTKKAAPAPAPVKPALPAATPPAAAPAPIAKVPNPASPAPAAPAAAAPPRPAVPMTKPLVHFVGVDMAAKIAASYSGDKIAARGQVSNPFLYEGALYICTEQAAKGNDVAYWCYKLVNKGLYKGTPLAYNDMLHVKGVVNYDGMFVSFAGEDCVLVGPKLEFAMRATKGGKKNVSTNPVPEPLEVEQAA